MRYPLSKITLFTSFLLLFTAYANALIKGNGTAQDPYQISTCKDLQNMQQNLSASYVLTNDIDCTDTRNWNSGQGFIPVGNGVHPPQTAFSGNFDGNNYKIFNLYISIPGQNGIGLFGYNSGNIENVGLENVDINTTSLVPSSVVGTGSLVGTNAGKGIISTCYSKGAVKGQYITGGLVGVSSGTIKNSYSIANVIVKASTASTNTFGGGLVGVLRSGTITSSYATGNVEGSAPTNATITLGGLVGNHYYATINSSFATGTINPRTTGRANSGGLVGMTLGSATIKNSYATGAVYSGGTGSSTGGLVGSPAAISKPAISNSYAIGCVAQGQKSSTIGGLVGGATLQSIISSYYNLDTSCQSDTKNGVTGVTDVQMKHQATFTGWDFLNTWAINEGKYYPVLPWDAGKTNLYDAQAQLQEFEKHHTEFYNKYGSFQGITYNVTDGNTVASFQTPNIWSQSLATVGYITWEGQSDFSDLPDCTQNQNICQATNTQCLHLNAFNNGITGQDTKRCVSNADKMVDNIYYVMTSANTSIDITTLEPFPDGRFLAAMRNAITWLAVNNRNVTIRVLGGVPLGYHDNQDVPDEILQQQSRVNDNQFLQQLVQDIPPDKSNNISVYVGSMRTCGAVPLSKCLPKTWFNTTTNIAYRASWNHSKIIDADGKLSLVGGENWFTNSYLVNNPVNDVNLEVSGPASRDASNFVNQLWNFICIGGNKALKTLASSTSWINGEYGTSCLATIPLPAMTFPKDSMDSATIMAIGRLGAGMFDNNIFFGADEPANQSEIVRNLLFKGAVSTVRIAQQNTQGLAVMPGIGYNYTPSQFERNNDAGNVHDILTNLLLESGDVYIVETNYGAVDGAGEAYYTQSKLTDVADTFLNRAKALRPNLSSDVLNSLLCEHLHLAGIRYSSDALWPNQKPIGNHSKVWIVDDNAYYVGSHNIYAANLQEYGYIVGGQLPTQSFMQQFWEPLWQYSQKSAISGSEIPVSACYYNTPDNLTSFTCAARSMIEQSPFEIGYKGCQVNGNKDHPLKFVKSTTNMSSHPDAFVCDNYTSGQNSDVWTGCGRGQTGKDDYQIGLTGVHNQKSTVLDVLKSWGKVYGPR